VHRVSLDAGLTCPNVDGAVARGGCVYCDNRSFSPSRRGPRQPIRSQLEIGIRRVQRRYACEHFLAYFQPATNTYASVDQLRGIYAEARRDPRVVGLVIGTRPDCLSDEVLDLLQGIAAETYLSLEIGLQTIHDRSLDWMNRGHHYDVFLDAVSRCRGRGFGIGTHLIFGLPGESREDMLATTKEVARLKLDAVKFHNLYAVKNTPLAEQVTRGEVSLIQQDDYIRVLVEALEFLPATTVVERLSGDAPPEFLVAPQWCLNRTAIRAAVVDELERRNTCQGRLHANQPV
jgi:radical SAM protein (TIGR01212 family)